MNADLVTDNGNQYVLVKAVPDRGEVVLTDGGTAGISGITAQVQHAEGRGAGAIYLDIYGRQVRSGVLRSGVYVFVEAGMVARHVIVR